jgi:hypothetical protein
MTDSSPLHLAGVPALASRCYASQAGLRQMLDMLVQAGSRTDDWRYGYVLSAKAGQTVRG